MGQINRSHKVKGPNALIPLIQANQELTREWRKRSSKLPDPTLNSLKIRSMTMADNTERIEIAERGREIRVREDKD